MTKQLFFLILLLLTQLFAVAQDRLIKRQRMSPPPLPTSHQIPEPVAKRPLLYFWELLEFDGTKQMWLTRSRHNGSTHYYMVAAEDLQVAEGAQVSTIELTKKQAHDLIALFKYAIRSRVEDKDCYVMIEQQDGQKYYVHCRKTVITLDNTLFVWKQRVGEFPVYEQHPRRIQALSLVANEWWQRTLNRQTDYPEAFEKRIIELTEAFRLASKQKRSSAEQ